MTPTETAPTAIQPAGTVRITGVALLPAKRKTKAKAAAKRRKRPAAAVEAPAAPVRRFGLTARERTTVPLGLAFAAALWFVPGLHFLVGAVLLFSAPFCLLFSPIAFGIDGLLYAFGKRDVFGFGVKLFLYGLLGSGFGLYLMPPMTGSPVMLDLNGDGRLGTTAASTARQPHDRTTTRTVAFDLAGGGHAQTIAWSDGGGDAFVVDDRDGGATRAARGAGVIDGKRLFGDEGGRFASGYDKLAGLDGDRDGVLTGAELAGLAAWVDDGDARVEAGELTALTALGITSLDVRHRAVTNARGEVLDQAGFTRDGRRGLTEDVWFPLK